MGAGILCNYFPYSIAVSMAFTIHDIPTPCVLIDRPRAQANITRMQSRMDALGVKLRPHVKTSKCLEVVRRQREAGARGITVSTLKEAEEFFAAGKPCFGCEQEFFPEGHVRTNFLCNLGYGDPSALHPRLPRLPFDEACSLL